jgi:rod shape-determining protein MreB
VRSAEEVKCQIGNAVEFNKENDFKAVLRGRDLKTGLPRSMEVKPAEIREALQGPIYEIIDGVKDALEDTPAELMSDIVRDGIMLAGGTSLLRGLDKLMAYELKVPVRVSKDPQTCVVRGCGILLDDIRLLERVRIK